MFVNNELGYRVVITKEIRINLFKTFKEALNFENLISCFPNVTTKEQGLDIF